MISEINHIFNHSSCLTFNEIEQYVSGTLNENDKRRVELHLADCQMCSDEIDGFALLKDKNSLPDIVAGLHKQTDEIISAGKVIPLQSSRKKNIKRLFSIAASLILLLGAGFVINFYLNNADNNLAETSAAEQNIKENTILNEPEENIVKEQTVKTDGTIRKNQNENTEKISANLSEQNENNIETDKSEAVEHIPESEDIKENAEEISYESDNDIIDNVNTGNVSADENTANNSATLVSGLAEDKKVKSEEKPTENISFTTTRGADFKRKNTVNKKEIEKFKSMRESALLSYSMKIWDEALKDFNSYLKYKPNDYEIIYKSGVSYYNLKKYNKAVTQFNKVISEGINRYVENAEWYKAQSLIKLGKKSEAKIILNSIIVKNGKYQNQALDLLNSLN